MQTVFTYEKMGYVGKLVKDGICIGTWVDFNLSSLLNQIECWKATNIK